MLLRSLFLTILIIQSFILSGCSSQKEIDLRERKALPEWYLNPPQTTTSMLYATAEGRDSQDAISNALSMMASTLSVSISSQFNSKTVVKEGLQNSISSTVSNEVQSDVKKIRISHYEVLNSQEFGFEKYIVLIKSDKTKLFLSLKRELDQKFNLIENRISQVKKDSSLVKLKVYKESKVELEDTQYILTIMAVLDGSFRSIEYLERLAKIQNSYEKELLDISFSIECDEASKNLEVSIKQAINSKKIEIKNGSGEKHFRVVVRSNIQRASSYGFTLARSAIEITIKDHKNSVVGSSKLNITGQSTQGYEIAKESIAIKFDEMIKKEGIGKIIGVEL